MQTRLEDITSLTPSPRIHGHQSPTVPRDQDHRMAMQKSRLVLHRTSLAEQWLCMTAQVAELRAPCCRPISSWCET